MGLNKFGFRTTGRQVLRVDQIVVFNPSGVKEKEGFDDLVEELEGVKPPIFQVQENGLRFSLVRPEDIPSFLAFCENGVDWFEVEIKAEPEPLDVAVTVEEVE